MNSSEAESVSSVHVVAMPYPGRGHINPMINFCKLLASRGPDFLITFVVTEEWLGFIGSDPKPCNIRFATLPNVVPSDRLRAANFPAFYEAVMTKLESPFEQLLDRLQPSVSVIVSDVELLWPVGVGNRRNIPVAAFWTMSATFFSMLHKMDLFSRRDVSQHPVQLSEAFGSEEQDYFSGLSSTQKADLERVFQENDKRVLQLLLDCVSLVSKAQYLVLTSIYELEPQIMEALTAEFPFPVLPIGPAIAYWDLENKKDNHNNPDYLQWLDDQPANSVLYVSFGSFAAVSGAQMDEIGIGLKKSGVRFLWVAREEAGRQKEKCGHKGMVVAWCDQLKVLCHSAVAGFWSHCGWNSCVEALYAGVPLLTFPLFLDQVVNSSQIVEEWMAGWRMKGSTEASSGQVLIREDEIASVVQRLMEGGGMEIRERARQVRDVVRGAADEGGSSRRSLDDFMKSIS